MKATFLLSILLSNCIFTQAQITWLHDYTSAKAMAIQDDKLILIDFTASWCQPCKIMDRDLWASKEMEQYKDKFVFFKADVDFEKALAQQFQINGIPHVAITTINDNRISHKRGYTSAYDYLQFFKGFPSKLDGLNITLSPFMNGTQTETDIFAAGLAFQVLALNAVDINTQNDFVLASEQYYKSYLKTKKELFKRVELLSAINQASLGKSKKIIAKILNQPADYFGEELIELKNTALAFCYKKEGNIPQMNELKGQIEDKALLDILEK